MRIFVTGGNGFVGTALIGELLMNGHQVLGLARSEDAGLRLAAIGADVERASLDDLDALGDAARRCDAVVHLAFGNDYTNFVENCEADERAIRAIGDAIVGTGKPFIIPNGLAGIAPGRIVTEDDDIPTDYAFPRRSEQTALALARADVNAMVVRLAQVHGKAKQGLVTGLIGLARQTGVSAYVGDGTARWPAVHVADAARLFRRVLESPRPGARYHAVAEQGLTMRTIAETVGEAISMPVRSIAAEMADEHFGPLAMFASQDMPASSDITKSATGWHPIGPGLLSDLAELG